jgi:dynein heavy chain, axonemal
MHRKKQAGKQCKRANALSGLAGEKTRWEETVLDLETQMGYLVGDCLLAAALLSYTGPFFSQYRQDIIDKIWF